MKLKTEDKAAEVTLQQCKDQVSLKKYNHYWNMHHRRSVYELMEIMDEASELYASQVSVSKDAIIEHSNKLYYDLIKVKEKELTSKDREIEYIKKVSEKVINDKQKEIEELKNICQVNDNWNRANEKTISDQSKTIEELKEKLTEVKEVMNFLRMYGMIHTVKAVVYAEGSHEYFMKKAQALNS